MHCINGMADPLKYTIHKGGEDHNIIIRPVNPNAANGNSTGVFKLMEGQANMGDIIFDDKMQQWEYTGIGNLTHQEASEIAGFIKVNSQTK